MKQFLVLYHAPLDAMEDMGDKSLDEVEKGMEPWMKWAKECGDALVDLGKPLGNGTTVTREGTQPSTKYVAGYSILQAESLDKALEMLQNHPHLDWLDTCEIEIHEMMPLPGM